MSCALPGQPWHPEAPGEHLKFNTERGTTQEVFRTTLKTSQEVFRTVVEAGCHVCPLCFISSDKCRSLGYLHSRGRRVKAVYRKLSSPMPLLPGAGDSAKCFSLEMITTNAAMLCAQVISVCLFPRQCLHRDSPAPEGSVPTTPSATAASWFAPSVSHFGTSFVTPPLWPVQSSYC